MNKVLIQCLASALCALLSLSSQAHAYTVGDIQIEHPHAFATVQGQSVGGVYFKHIANKASKADRLMSASVASSVADHTELHTMSTDNDVMRMRQVSAIDLPAKTTVPMSRGLKKNGYHLMLMGLKTPLKVGDTLPVKLKFKRAGVIEVVVNVELLKADSGTTEHQH